MRYPMTAPFPKALVRGILLLLTALFQWRAMSRMTEVMAARPQLPAPAPAGLLTAEAGAPSGQAVAISNQRLMSVVDRMERPTEN